MAKKRQLRPVDAWMVLSIICLLAILFVRCATGQETYSVHQSKLPKSKPAIAGQIIVHGHLYSAAINPETKFADWVCYRVTAADFATRNAITRRWINGLDESTLEYQDYSGDEYDMGHLVPLGSYSASRYAYECNWLGVVAPQRPDLNRGPWLAMERRVRDLAASSDYVDVACGAIYATRQPKVSGADEPHRVPSHYWVSIRPSDGDRECYVMPQAAGRSAELSEFAVDLADLEKRAYVTLGGGDG